MILAELGFQWTEGLLVFGALALATVGWLSFLAYRRSEWALGTGLLEALRVLIVALALATLLAPEWREETRPRTDPVLLVLRDASGSLATRDAVSASGAVATRSEELSELLPASLWEGLERVEVIEETFGGPLQSDLNAALAGLLARYENLRAVVLASDGDWNEGETPLVAGTEFRTRGIPIYTVGLGSESELPDVEIAALDPPSYSVVGKSLQIPFTLRSTLPREHRVTVTLELREESGLERQLTKEVVVPARGRVRDMFFFEPTEVGSVLFRLDVPAHPREVIEENNRREVKVEVRAESLKVLVIESFPRWEYRYLRNALERDPGVEVSCLLFHPGLPKRGGGPGYLKEFPVTREELARYDVVFLGDVGVGLEQLTLEECTRLKGLVEHQASGLVFLPGFRGHQFTLLESGLRELYPVVLDASQPRGFGSRRPGRFLLTQAGERSLLTRLADVDDENLALWRDLPGFQWRSPALRSKAGTEVLAIDEFSRAPLLVTKPYGTGKVLFMGTDGAWRWREGVEDRYHYRFWGQVARWMAYQRHMAEGEMLRLFYSPERPPVGAVVNLNSTVLDPTGAPLSRGKVVAELVDPSGASTRLHFEPVGEDWGLYRAGFLAEHPGEHRLRLECAETGAVLETTILVEGERAEKVGAPARHEILRELAQVSRGSWVLPDEVESLREKVLSIPEPEAWVTRYPIWSSPFWAGFLVLLLGVFWVGRKLRGTI